MSRTCPTCGKPNCGNWSGCARREEQAREMAAKAREDAVRKAREVEVTWWVVGLAAAGEHVAREKFPHLSDEDVRRVAVQAATETLRSFTEEQMRAKQARALFALMFGRMK